MANGLTISYPSARPALPGPIILLLAFGVFVAHVLLLMLASIPPPTIQTPPQQRQLRISLAPLPMPFPMEDREAERTRRPEAGSPEPKTPERLPETEIATPLPRPEEKRETEPEAPAPPEPETAQPRPEPEPEPEKAAPAKPEEPNLAPLVNVQVADDTAEGQEKPPANAQYEGATNTEAADRSDKKKIGPDPKIDGESGEVRFAGRRGETENRQAPRENPMAGSIQKEGSPDLGKPPEPQTQVAQLPEPVPADVPEPVMLPPNFEKPVDQLTAEPKPATQDAQDTATVKDPEPDGVDPLKQRTPVQDEARRREQAPAPLAQRQPDPVPPEEQPKRPAPAPREQDLAEARKPATQPLDPELARLQRILERPQAAPENPRTDRGAGTREGQVGHEGDGSVREGELNAVSDVISATMTSAAKEGDVAFSKRATPEQAYLKPFFRRMDAKWKAVFFSDNRALSRLEYGEVQVRFTFDKAGRLTEAVEVSRRGTVSDKAVHACLEGLRRAAPHDAFPATLAGREKLTDTIMFLYR